jgi:hypothetical protein
MKVTEETIDNAVRRLRAYDSLQRKNTSEVGWISFEKARARMAAELTPEEIAELQAAMRAEGYRFQTAICDVALGREVSAELVGWEKTAIDRMTADEARLACLETIARWPLLAKKLNAAR